jgi:hypothetical protein
VVDWKSTVVDDLLAFVRVDVPSDHLVGDRAEADREVASRPEMPTPEPLAQVRKLLLSLELSRQLVPATKHTAFARNCRAVIPEMAETASTTLFRCLPLIAEHLG